ncbi:unnamed protein product [Arabidopsis lyrata]|nr:unnamed protein product [Arabidopsis lyrata]
MDSKVIGVVSRFSEWCLGAFMVDLPDPLLLWLLMVILDVWSGFVLGVGQFDGILLLSYLLAYLPWS